MDACEVLLIPDITWAIMTIAQEARSETLDGQIAVAEIIRNRTNQKFFSDGTIRGTVLWPRQFSGWNSGDPNRIICAGLSWGDPITQSAYKAWKIAIKNNTELTLGAVQYHADYMKPFPDWIKDFQMTAHIGVHIFYKRIK